MWWSKCPRLCRLSTCWRERETKGKLITRDSSWTWFFFCVIYVPNSSRSVKASKISERATTNICVQNRRLHRKENSESSYDPGTAYRGILGGFALIANFGVLQSPPFKFGKPSIAERRAFPTRGAPARNRVVTFYSALVCLVPCVNSNLQLGSLKARKWKIIC